MEINKVIFWGCITLIVILSIFNIRILTLGNEFEKYCTIQYNLSDPCPCMAKNQVIGEYGEYSNYIIENISLKPLYTQNSSVS